MSQITNCCPFCGEKSSVFSLEDEWRVECVSIHCDAKGPIAETPDKAIKLWNQPTAIDRIAKQLGLDQPCIEMILWELQEHDVRIANARKMIGKLQGGKVDCSFAKAALQSAQSIIDRFWKNRSEVSSDEVIDVSAVIQIAIEKLDIKLQP